MAGGDVVLPADAAIDAVFIMADEALVPIAGLRRPDADDAAYRFDRVHK